MTLQPADLLSGPRGRRVCLEFALWGHGPENGPADELRQTAFYAAHALDAGRDTSVFLFGADAGAQAEPEASPADAARLVHAAPIADPSAEGVMVALKTSVDRAMYWQAPDGDDALAGTPEVSAALDRVAGVISASAAAAWWSEPLERSGQWQVTFAEPDRPVPAVPPPAREALDRWRAEVIEEESAAQRTRPTDPSAMFSGSWWSTPPRALTHTTRTLGNQGPVGLKLVEDGFGWTAASAEHVPVPGDARVYEIDGPDAWAELARRYPLEVTASRRHDWFRTTDRSGRWLIPDWSRVRQDYDAIHLTVGGYLATAGRAVPVTDDLATVLAGWDPDQTYWLRDLASDAGTHQEWRTDPNDETWTRLLSTKE